MSGQVQVIATGASVAGNMMARNPQLDVEYKFVLKDSPNFIGVAKGEDKLRVKVNEIILAAKASGDLNKMSQKWLGRPTGNAARVSATLGPRPSLHRMTARVAPSGRPVFP